jgi:hypothetical protein
VLSVLTDRLEGVKQIYRKKTSISCNTDASQLEFLALPVIVADG